MPNHHIKKNNEPLSYKIVLDKAVPIGYIRKECLVIRETVLQNCWWWEMDIHRLVFPFCFVFKLSAQALLCSHKLQDIHACGKFCMFLKYIFQFHSSEK